MNARDLIDKTREANVDSNSAPTRVITYIRSSDDTSIPLNSFVGGGEFTKEEKEKIGDYQFFRALKLEQVPQTGLNGDKVVHDGVTYNVRRCTKLGSLRGVYGEISRHRGRPTK